VRTRSAQPWATSELARSPASGGLRARERKLERLVAESLPGHHKNLKIQKSNFKNILAHELIHELIHEQLCLKAMSNIKFQNRKIRKLSKVGKGRSFAVTIPIEYIKKLGWKERQKLVVELKNQSIIIKDWKK